MNFVIPKEIQWKIKQAMTWGIENHKNIPLLIATCLAEATGRTHLFIDKMNAILNNGIYKRNERIQPSFASVPEEDTLLKEYFAFQIAMQQDIGKTADTMQLITDVTAHNLVDSLKDARLNSSIYRALPYLEHVVKILGKDTTLTVIDNIRNAPSLKMKDYKIIIDETKRKELVRYLLLFYYDVPAALVYEMYSNELWYSSWISENFTKEPKSLAQLKMFLGIHEEVIAFWSSSDAARPDSAQQLNEEFEIIFRYVYMLMLKSEYEVPYKDIPALTQQAIAATIGKRTGFSPTESKFFKP